MKGFLTFLLCYCFAAAQDSEFLIHHTFESGLSGWDTRGGHVRTAVNGDQHSLAFDYDFSSALVATSPLNGPAVEITARTEQIGQPVALYRRMTNFVLDATDGIEFDVASADPSAIVCSISVRTPDGVRNDLATTPLPVTGARIPVHLRLPYERFAQRKDFRVIPKAIVTLTVARVGLKAGESAFWIGNVRAFRNQPSK